KKFGAILVTGHSFIGNFPVLYNPGEEGARPSMMRAIEESYMLYRKYPSFGYFDRDLDMYVPR
ncbi:hypothetical protein JW905_05665, partial [bacterium]|nr:hypothetical protein [candidate division CSSED10-310 bacterium]